MQQEKPLSRLFWLDMEMTGLNEKTCHILEVAAAITDLELDVLEEYHQVVFQPKEALNHMNEWCSKTHRKSGLLSAVETGARLDQVETSLVHLANRHYGTDKVVLCGNTIGQDRKFLEAYMPLFTSLLHYRTIDVSSFKEVFRSKYSISYEKKDTHRARDDIFESIAELRHYLSFVRV